MKEYKKMLAISAMIDQLKTPRASEDEQYDLLDRMSAYLDNARYQSEQTSILDPVAIWEEIFNNNITKLRGQLLPYLSAYEPFPHAVLEETIETLEYNKQVMNVIISVKYKMIDAFRKIHQGIPHDKAYAPNVLALISECNISPREFTDYIIDTAIALRDRIEVVIDLDNEELESILDKAENEMVKYLLVTQVSSIPTSEWSRFSTLGEITLEDVVKAVNEL